MEIKEMRKSKKKYVVLSDSTSHSFSEETVLKFQLFEGKIWTKEELDDALRYEAKFNLIHKTLGFISFKERSVREVSSYLDKKDIPSVEKNEILEKLKNLGYLDDQRFIKNAIENYVASNKGKRYIRHKLMEKGLEKSLIDEELEKIEEEQETQRILMMLTKDMAKIHHLPINKQRQLLMQKYSREGFSISAIKKAIATTEFTSNHQETLKKEYEKLLRKHDKPTKEAKQKIIGSLLQKGFGYSEIASIMKSDESDLQLIDNNIES